MNHILAFYIMVVIPVAFVITAVINVWVVRDAQDDIEKRLKAIEDQQAKDSK